MASKSSTKDLSVSVVIPTWNGLPLLLKNLPYVISAKKNNVNRIAEIIIVDDGSADETSKYIKKNFGKEVRLIKHTRNRGFSATVNTGVRMAKCKLVCLLNNDVVPSETFLKHSLQHFTDGKVFAVCFHEKGYGNAVGYFKEGFVEHRGGKEKDTVQDTFWANGGSSLFSRSIWLELKGMDDALFSPFYWEDIDLSYRALKRGYKVLWEPQSMVVHKHETTINTSNFRKKYMDIIKERNELLFIWKNITSTRLFRKHITFLLRRILQHPGYIRVFLEAYKKRKEVMLARKIEVKGTVVSDEAIFAKFSH